MVDAWSSQCARILYSIHNIKIRVVFKYILFVIHAKQYVQVRSDCSIRVTVYYIYTINIILYISCAVD